MESEVRSKESRKYVISSLDDLVKVPSESSFICRYYAGDVRREKYTAVI